MLYKRSETTPTDTEVPEIQKFVCLNCGQWAIQVVVATYPLELISLGKNSEEIKQENGYDVLRKCDHCGFVSQEWWK